MAIPSVPLRADAARITIENGFSGRPWIYVDGDHNSRVVRSVSTMAQIAQDQIVCKSGARTGKSCGRVKSKNYSPPGTTDGDFIRASYCAAGGDSGAGVYLDTQAIGIHNGGGELGCAADGWS